jgi:hypothetical protein
MLNYRIVLNNAAVQRVQNTSANATCSRPTEEEECAPRDRQSADVLLCVEGSRIDLLVWSRLSRKTCLQYQDFPRYKIVGIETGQSSTPNVLWLKETPKKNKTIRKLLFDSSIATNCAHLPYCVALEAKQAVQTRRLSSSVELR